MSKEINKKTIKETTPNLSKRITDTEPHNFVVYLCLKDNVSIGGLKNMIGFAKTKDKRISKLNIIHIEDVTKDNYKYRTISILLKCNAQQYIIFKNYLLSVAKKYLIGSLEATQKDIEKYAV